MARKRTLEALAARVKNQGSISPEEPLREFDWFRSWTSVERSGNELATLSDIPESAVFFDGHFPDMPVMPGVFILLGVLKTIQEHRGVGLPKRIESFGFMSPVLPRSRMIIDAGPENQGLYKVAVFTNGILSAKGDLVYNSTLGGE